jgi:TRAP-type C4-dicarboxylate transport system permease small subunit
MRRISRLSNTVLRVEKRVITLLAALLVVLIFLNIVTRMAGAALFWGDELAIYTMVWMTLIGASAMVRMRAGVAVTLVTDVLPQDIRRVVFRIADAVLLLLAVTLLILCWQWYDPVALIESGFDLDAFAQDTFKFVYAEPTSTLGVRKFWIWLVVPLMATAMTIHAVANLLEGPREDAPVADVGAGSGA